MKKSQLLKLTTLFLFSSILSSQIISYELITSWSQEEVENLYNQYGIPSSTGEINYSVDGYKILYFTPDFNGELVICSGAIFLPVAIGCSPPILSWQHGTESDDNGAPSNIGFTSNDLTGVIAASHGYIVMMSDFIGLGEGEGFHNYVHADTEASATIDLIIYGKEFATEMLGIQPSEQLFLFGYSQGGHATMAAVKEIEANYSDQLQVTASAPMAGPYDMSESQRLMLEAGAPYPSPGYLPYLLFAYNKIYNLYEDINDVLIPPYNNFLYNMYNGTYGMLTINALLPEVPIEIFTDEYYQEYLNNENHPFKLALIDNDVYNFVPQSPMRLLHCNGDDNVTYENAQVAYDYFVKNGADNVELIDGGNFTHLECASIAILAGKIWIDSMAELCEPTNLNESITRKKEIVKSVDILGRNINNHKQNNTIIDIYSDGTHRKRLTIK
ncbi:MAG: hypothetical protein CMD23_03275 [Flavobacteriales bacterium]|nr:hypothetical protein [Flavobacteriales bacterium]